MIGCCCCCFNSLFSSLPDAIAAVDTVDSLSKFSSKSFRVIGCFDRIALSLRMSGFDGVVIMEDEANGVLLLDLILSLRFNSIESKSWLDLAASLLKESSDLSEAECKMLLSCDEATGFWNSFWRIGFIWVLCSLGRGCWLSFVDTLIGSGLMKPFRMVSFDHCSMRGLGDATVCWLGLLSTLCWLYSSCALVSIWMMSTFLFSLSSTTSTQTGVGVGVTIDLLLFMEAKNCS